MSKKIPSKPSIPFLLHRLKNIQGSDDGPTDLSTNHRKYFEGLLIEKHLGKEDKRCLDEDLQKMKAQPETLDDELPPEFIREIKRRAADLENPIRYIIYSQITPKEKTRLFFNISDSTFCDNVDTATLFKREYMAKAIVNAYSIEKNDMLDIAKITIKNKNRKVLKYKI